MSEHAAYWQRDGARVEWDDKPADPGLLASANADGTVRRSTATEDARYMGVAKSLEIPENPDGTLGACGWGGCRNPETVATELPSAAMGLDPRRLCECHAQTANGNHRRRVVMDDRPSDAPATPEAAATPPASVSDPECCAQCGAEFGYVSRDHAMLTHCRDCAERWYKAETRRRIEARQSEGETPAPPTPAERARGWDERFSL